VCASCSPPARHGQELPGGNPGQHQPRGRCAQVQHDEHHVEPATRGDVAGEHGTQGCPDGAHAVDDGADGGQGLGVALRTRATNIRVSDPTLNQSSSMKGHDISKG